MSHPVTILYFAALRDAAGVARETLATSAPDLAALYDELRARHGFSFERARLRVAVGDAFVPWHTPLPTDGEVAFIPPVSGG